MLSSAATEPQTPKLETTAESSQSQPLSKTLVAQFSAVHGVWKRATSWLSPGLWHAREVPNLVLFPDIIKPQFRWFRAFPSLIFH